VSQSTDTDRLFDLFDKEGAKALTLREFMRGLGLACRGTVHDKQLLTFQVYAGDKGYVTR
jgi:Ca2+-binding EF-hand superfamily protein